MQLYTSASAEVLWLAGLLRRFWRAYIKALDEQPILVKSATSFFGFLIGDLLAQVSLSPCLCPRICNAAFVTRERLCDDACMQNRIWMFTRCARLICREPVDMALTCSDASGSWLLVSQWTALLVRIDLRLCSPCNVLILTKNISFGQHPAIMLLNCLPT